MSLLGGVASPIGSAIGTGLLILIPEWLRFLKTVPGLYLAIYGLFVILIIRFMPDGIWGFVSAAFERWRAQTKVPPAVKALQLKPAAVGGENVLEVTGLAKHFGGLKAVDGVDIAVRRGGVHALIGPNGSRKTTTLNVLSGLYKATAGKIVLDGTDITNMPPHQRTAAGLGRTFQNIRLFRSMTALENVEIGAERHGNTMIGHGGDAALTERAMEALTFVGLGNRANELISSFSYGHQRLIEIARALASNPTLLLLDEPAAGLNSTEKLELHELLKRIAAQGLTILIIDHDMTWFRKLPSTLPCSISAAASRTASRWRCCAIPTSSPPISGASDAVARNPQSRGPLRRDRSAARRHHRRRRGAGGDAARRQWRRQVDDAACHLGPREARF